jgi:YHS domain-containing protein
MMRVLGWVLVFIVLYLLLWPLFKKWLPRASERRRAIGDELVKDPVCQTYVLRSRALPRTVGGITHYFCGPECAARYAGLRGQM